MRYVADALIAFVIGLTCALVAFGPLACVDTPPSSDAGADPDISDCCNWYILPLLYDRPGDCLCQHTNEGEQRWLTCLGGLVEYTCDRRGE